MSDNGLNTREVIEKHYPEFPETILHAELCRACARIDGRSIKQALLIPERKRHNWSQAVMRDCDFCSQWSLTVKHENGGHICASCCDVEYTSALKDALEMAIERADAAEKRLEELEARNIDVKWPAYVDGNTLGYGEVNHAIDLCVDAVEKACHAAGIKIKGE